jgi:hypothetical protein
MPGPDDQVAIFLRDDWRLDDVTGLDGSEKLLILRQRRRRCAWVVWVRLECTRIDAAELHDWGAEFHDSLLYDLVLSPVFFGRPLPPAAVAAAGARAKPAEPGHTRVRGRTLAAAAVTAAASSLFQNKSVYWLCYPVRRTRKRAGVEDRHLRVPWLGS